VFANGLAGLCALLSWLTCPWSRCSKLHPIISPQVALMFATIDVGIVGPSVTAGSPGSLLFTTYSAEVWVPSHTANLSLHAVSPSLSTFCV
jgi:hypothetical protein